MLQRARTGRNIVKQVLGQFMVVDNAAPDWLLDPETGRQLAVDKLYPELGIAIGFKNSQGTPPRDETLAALCRQAGIKLILMRDGDQTTGQALTEIQTALSTAARRVAQRLVAREAKLDLLPRIASAQATCQQILSTTPETSTIPYHSGRWRHWRLQTQANWRRFRGAWQVFAQNRLALLGVALLVMFALMSVAYPVLLSTVWPARIYNANTGFDEELMHPSPPSTRHLLGTDTVGRDALSVLLASTTPTFIVGLTAAVVTATIGTTIGVIAAYFKGVVDATLTHLADVFLLMPTPIIMVIIGARFKDIGPTTFGLIYGLIAGLGGAVIVMRSHALTVMTKPFIEAARVAGGGARRIMFTHVLPHMLPLTAVYMMVTVIGAVVADGFVAFMGVTRVHHNWGTMIYMALAYRQMIANAMPWNMLLSPSIAFSLFAAAFYFISRGLHEVAEPRLRKR
jgi:peptide/nickel transport system permease protein